ncbi:3-hydroxy-3-methylglutaryl-coenzyme A reductase [Mytilinidion resinicola]|uniref:3-hydroxy-3-methylglutaryl coenzyme A reductase n=1 Tax=Mytilinidion resinicola TaxID=574789 RepID=A0A6A6Z4S8_9PEZI|nr:3-hydroxy-3-methylglutaryl-coenzyme A reductase [Mytilinidion resinicola]KAF2815663.1 3-hydroxy-3-methylglutaryl-coenzyme A reductase [Mytilinidion resinicola]
MPTRWRGGDSAQKKTSPSWYDRHLSPVLLSISKRACTHPIHTIVFVALLASTTYIGVLDHGLFDRSPVISSTSGKVDFNTLMVGSKRLRVGEDTDWQWQVEETGSSSKLEKTTRELALLTLVFPDLPAFNSAQTAPLAQSVIPNNSSAKLLPSSTSSFSNISPDTSLAFSISLSEAPEFLAAMQEIPPAEDIAESQDSDHEGTVEAKKWIMKAARSGSGSGGLRNWTRDSWTSFVDLLKNAETLDIVIMVMGYLSMHLTFVSLFLSMRRLGSNFWLAATVLFQSAFAFLFALLVTLRLGVPINMVLLSEGLPFLVVTIGFEKPIILTKAVLSASIDARRSQNTEGGNNEPITIQNAVQAAVKEHGFEIVRDYCIEILILVAGSLSGVQGGLRQFCFLAAWILVFDGVLLFTFFTSILSIKLEINRIKRHVNLRRALEDDGVNRSVAESVAASNDWPRNDSGRVNKSGEHTVFGKKVRDNSIPKFKVLMVTGFILVNVLNVCTLPFRASRHPAAAKMSRFSSVVAPPPMDPFKVAGSGLDSIFASAQASGISTAVTVVAPIKYELQFPSVHYASPGEFGSDSKDHLSTTMGGRVVDGLLKSLEDPVLSKWIIAALVMSLVLNGYLFNAARWTIKDPHTPLDPPMAEEIQEGAPPNVSTSLASPRPSPQPQTPQNGYFAPEVAPLAEIVQPQPIPIPAPVFQPIPEPSPFSEKEQQNKRPIEVTEALLKEKKVHLITDAELVELSIKGKIPGYALEKTLGDKTRAVKIRRAVVSRTHATRETSTLLERSKLPYENYNYDLVHGACCENVIGYLPLPVGVAGPMMVDGQNYFLPMATTEGVLVASTSRGAKAINSGGGAVTVITGDGMTRGPCVCFETLARAGAAKLWLDSEEGQRVMKNAFNSTSRFARLQTMKTALAGNNLYIRFKTTTGDAMGMNMISKGVEHALGVMATEGFEDMNIITVSGNYCTDKKAAAINWIDGRGKGVVAEAIIPGHIVKSVLKCGVDELVELNINKNLIGSAMAGSIGGFNAHAANIVAAMFLATGQDPAQVMESANCITIMKNLKGNLQISVSMPSIEVGTLGGGTILEPQSAMLDLLGVRGAHPTNPGDNSRLLARVIAAAVLAGELSLNAALCAGHLVRAHMAHNRSQAPSAAPSRAPTPAPPQLMSGGAQTPASAAVGSIRDAASRAAESALPRR